MTCQCMTCQIARIAYGKDLSNVQPQQAADGIQSLAQVLAVGLSYAEDDALDVVIEVIKDARAQARMNVAMVSQHEAGHA